MRLQAKMVNQGLQFTLHLGLLCRHKLFAYFLLISLSLSLQPYVASSFKGPMTPIGATSQETSDGQFTSEP